MKIVKHTSLELILRQQSPLSWFIIWAIALIGFPATVGYHLVLSMGNTTLSCSRTESNHITCEHTTSPFLGVVKAPPQTFGDVVGARIEPEALDHSRSQVRERYSITLIQPTGEVPSYLSLQAPQAEDMVHQIKTFISSEESNLVITQASPHGLIDPDVVNLVQLAMLSVLMVVGIQLLFPFEQTRHFAVDKRQNQFRLRQRGLNGEAQHPLDQIERIDIRESSACDALHYYYSEIILKTGERYEVERSYSKYHVETHALSIRNFLKLRDRPERLCPEDEHRQLGFQDDESQAPVFLFQGTKGAYHALPPQALHPTLDWGDLNAKLIALKFQHLGSFVCSKFENFVVHGYTHSQQPINALIIQVGSVMCFVDFYTVFTDGSSLTTSTMPGVADIRGRKIFRSSYPDLETAHLFSYHQERMLALSRQHGRPLPQKEDVRSLAQAIDEFFTRYPSSRLFRLQNYLVQFWMVILGKSPMRAKA